MDIKYRASEVTNKGSETSETIVRYQYKGRTHKRRTLQKSDSTNVGFTNVGLVQTSDLYIRRTSTNVGREKLRTLVEFEKNIAIRNKPKLCYCDNNRRQLNTVLSFEGSTSSRKQQTKKDQKGPKRS